MISLRVMKIKLNEIRGVKLSKEQMKNLLGGEVVAGTDKCTSTTCPTNSSWTCAANKLGTCRCSGVASQGGEVVWKDCTTAIIVVTPTPNDTIK